MCAVSLNFSADLEFVLVEKKCFHVALDLRQSHVKVTLGERSVNGLFYRSGLEGTVHCLGKGAHPSFQGGDIDLDLGEELRVRILQFIIQKSKVMTDAC